MVPDVFSTQLQKKWDSPSMENADGVTIILLNGTSSAGKTTIAKALQGAIDAPYLHVPIDSFEDMMPGPDQLGEPGSGPWQAVFNRVLSGFHHSIAALANAGSNLIVDHLLLQGIEPDNWLEECLDQLSPFTVYLVGVHCPLEELQRREMARGDRGIGLAERQFTQVHQHGIYDLEVDTSLLSAEECALLIKERVKYGAAPTALAAVRQMLKEQWGKAAIILAAAVCCLDLLGHASNALSQLSRG